MSAHRTPSHSPVPVSAVLRLLAAALAALLAPAARAQSPFAVAPGPDPALQGKIKVYEGTTQVEIPAFATGYGAHVAFSDVDDDDRSDVVAGEGPAPQNGNRVRGFRRDGTPIPGFDFLAYASNQHGVQVAGIEIPFAAAEEIVTLPGLNAPFGPQVRGWKYVTSPTPGVAPISQVNYYLSGSLATRATLSQGDFDADGNEEVLTTEATNLGTWLTATSFGANPGNLFRYLGGGQEVHASGGEVDGDLYDEILIGTRTSSGAPMLRGYNYDGTVFTAISALTMQPFTCLACSVRPSAGDLDGDGIQEMLLGSTAGKPMARAFNYDGSWVTSMWQVTAYPTGRYGARTAVSDSLY